MYRDTKMGRTEDTRSANSAKKQLTVERASHKCGHDASMGRECELSYHSRSTDDGDDRPESNDDTGDKEHGIVLRRALEDCPHNIDRATNTQAILSTKFVAKVGADRKGNKIAKCICCAQRTEHSP